MKFDRDYYERGIETRKSNYQNYRWIPELTIPMVMTIIDLLGIKQNDSVLDFGCAKGYVVKALRWLRRDAWGQDISLYAIENCDPEIRDFLNSGNSPSSFKFGICKDVLEHIPQEELVTILSTLNVTILFSVIPLGKNGKYVAPSNDMDETHIICESSIWWYQMLYNCGWRKEFDSYRVPGIKDSYAEKYPYSHLFMIHRRKGI